MKDQSVKAWRRPSGQPAKERGLRRHLACCHLELQLLFPGCERTHFCCLSHPARKLIRLHVICYQSSRNFQGTFLFLFLWITCYFLFLFFLVYTQSNWLHYYIFIKTLFQLISLPYSPNLCLSTPCSSLSSHVTCVILFAPFLEPTCLLLWFPACSLPVLTYTYHTHIYKNNS